MDEKIYKGSRAVIIPSEIIKKLESNDITKNLHITKAGFSPKATSFRATHEQGLHDNILLYCVDGLGIVGIDGKSYELKAQHFFIIPKNTPFSYNADTRHPWSIYWIHFNGLLDSAFARMYKQVNEIRLDDVNRIEGRILIFDEIFRNLELSFSNDNLEYSNICLWYLMASFCYINQFREIRRIRSIDITQQAISFMKEHVEDRLSLSDVASSVGLSPSHFSSLFTRKMDMTPMDYLNMLKIQRACQYLQEKDIKIKDLAFRLGFYDQFHFSKMFKKFMFYTPTKYREKIQKKFLD